MPVEEVDTCTLAVNDFIKVQTRNSIYVFQVIGADPNSGECIIKVAGGNKKCTYNRWMLLREYKKI